MRIRQRGAPPVKRNPVILSMVLAGALVACTGNATDDHVGEDDPVSAQPIAYTGERMSVNFQDVEVRSVLQLIADFAGLNLVAGQAVDGRMTLHMVDLPWDEVLDLVLRVNGLDKRQTGSVLLVAPAVEIAERERLELETQKARADLSPLTRAFIRLHYADAPALAKLLAGDGAATLSERGRVMADARSNSLIVTDTATNLGEIRRLIRELDVPVRQVQIEARIVNANVNFSEELGIRFGGAVFTTDGPPVLELGGNLRALASRDTSDGESGNARPDDLLVESRHRGRWDIKHRLGDCRHRLPARRGTLGACLRRSC